MNQYLNFRILLFFFCLLGCTYQVYYTSSQYFSYQTRTRVESNLQDVVRYPSSVLWSRINDFLAPDALSKLNITSNRNLHQLTIAQLHSLTPHANDSIQSCLMRLDDYDFYKHYQQNICYETFIVRKLILGDSVCYQFHPKVQLKYSIHRAANALNFSHIVYNLVLTQTFNLTTELYLITNYPTKSDDDSGIVQFPVYSRKFGQLLLRYSQERWIVQRPKERIFKLMPAPYDTDCLKGNHYCLRECYIQNTISKLKRFPFTEPADEFLESNGISSHLRLLSSIELENASIASVWLKIKKQCRRNCNKPSCEISATSNNAFAYYPWRSDPVSLTVSLPTSYPIKITALPEINWIDYMSGICNCISIWFGFSVIAVNPLKYCKRYTQFERGWKLGSLYSKLPLLTYYLLCVLGFLYQSGEIWKNYFLYQTSMTIEVSADDKYPYQSLGICFDYKELLDKTNYTRLRLLATSSNISNDWEDEYSVLNVRQIFDLTPDARSIISECGRRDDSNIGLDYFIGNECLKFFSVLKAIKADQVCYYFYPQMALTYLWSKVSSSYTDTSEVFQIKTAILINSSMLVTLFAYGVDEAGTNNKLPMDSRNFGHETTIYPETIVGISSATVNFNRLPAPYDTGCLSRFNPTECLFYCIDPKLSAFRRKSYLSLLTFPRDEKILNFQDVQNETVRSITLTTAKSCYSQCSGYPCHQTVSFTFGATHVGNGTQKDLSLISFLPNAPTIKVQYVPATDPLNFFINICNSCGIWFGLSIISLYPINLIRKGSLLFARGTQKPAGISKILQAIFAATCLAGFMWQVYHVTSTYFFYETYSRIKGSTQDIYRFPTINICLRYRDILNSDIITNNSASVKLIFKLTPLDNDTFSGCSYRDTQTDQMKVRSRSECLMEFKTAKYVFGAKVCYAYLSKESYSLSKVTSMPTHTGIVYEILLNNIFNKLSYITFYWFTEALNFNSSGIADRSRKYAFQVFRGWTSNRSTNYIFVQGMNYNITLLPEPYETRCLPGTLPSTCFSRCNMNNAKTLLDKVPFDEFILEPVNLRMISERDMTNTTVKSLVNYGFENCSRACFRRECNQYYSIPTALGYWKPNFKHNGIVIAAAVPSSNGLIVDSYPSLTLMDFLNNLAVSGSIWFGVSVISIAMYTVKLFKKQEKKLQRRSPNQRFRGFNKQFTISPRSYCTCFYCQKHFRNRMNLRQVMRSDRHED